MIATTSKAAPRIALPWIIRLRYAMAAGMLVVAFLVDKALPIDLPLRWIAIGPGLVVLSNLWISRKGTAPALGESTLIGWIFVLDTLCLTAVLMLTGGPNNPFSLLYLVHITLSAAILNQRQTWALGALASLCFALLFWKYRPIEALEMHHHNDGVNLHLTGMWAAFAVGSLLVAIFSGKISELLREREESLLRMQEELAKKDRLASLVTLAAGAAHELSTPLGTIALVAKDLEHYAMRTVHDSALAEDSRLIRTEVERCRAILERLSIDGAEPAGEALETVQAGALLDAARKCFAASLGVKVQGDPEDRQALLNIPRHAVEQALVALIKNGVEASPANAEVNVSVARSGRMACFVVKDPGTGMPPEVLRHVGEPFFTTKDPGRGMGLGIFLVRTVADRLGGRLVFDSLPGEGTRAVLELPLADSPVRAT